MTKHNLIPTRDAGILATAWKIRVILGHGGLDLGKALRSQVLMNLI